MVTRDWIHDKAQRYPHRVALVTPEGRWTYRELDQWVATAAGQLRTWGVRTHDRVAVALAPSAAYAVLVHAVARLGAVLVPLNTRWSPSELNKVVGHARPRLVLTDGAHHAQFSKAPTLSLADLLNTVGEPVEDGERTFDQIAAIVYTSGTTGMPKGVINTVGNQWWSAMGFGLAAGFLPEDLWLHVMPLFHVGGLSILLRAAIYGSGVVLLPRFDVDAVAHALSTSSITLMSVVPTMLHRLLGAQVAPPPSLRMVLLGGAPASGDLIAAAWQSGWPAYPSYGLTETASQITGLTRDDVHTRRGSSGHPILPTEIAIRIGDRLAPANQPGDIWVRGPTVSPGYWDNPEETQRTFQQGWLKTGDIGYLDRDGYLTVLDRRADLIITGGENVYPSEVESILTRHPAVVDAGVFGLPDPEWGQRVAAAVVARQPVSASDLQLHSKRFLAAYKVPTVYFWVESIPRTASGKILRRVLRKRIGNQARWER